MPRAPSTVLGRGIGGRAIFRDDFLKRLGVVAMTKTLAISTLAFLPYHLHLLVRTGATPLARAVRSLLTGSAGAFSGRHRIRKVIE